MNRPTRFSPWIGGLRVSVLVSLLSACGGYPDADVSQLATSEAAVQSPDTKSAEMVVYYAGMSVDQTTLIDLGPVENLGGVTLAGSPKIYARFDYNMNGSSAGIFKGTAGTVRITFPFNEHATIIDGEVTITDAQGVSHTFRKGDSYFIRQGQVVTWTVKRSFTKSFFNVVQQ